MATEETMEQLQAAMLAQLEARSALTEIKSSLIGLMEEVGDALSALNGIEGALIAAEAAERADVPPPDPGPSFPGQKAPRHPRIREFNVAGAVRVDPPMGPLEQVVARYGPQTDFLLAPGDYRINDVRALRGQYFLSQEGPEQTRLFGTGGGYGFRAKDPHQDDVTIGGFTLEGFCEGSGNALAAAVSPRWADTLMRTSEQDWYGGQPDNWVLHDCVLKGNGRAPNGYSMGNNGAAIRVKATGFQKTGIGVDRVSGGGLIDECELFGNGLKPAVGELSDGADAKLVWVNGYEGVTQVEPPALVPPRELFVVRRTLFRATGAASERGLWFDLDCQETLVDECEFHGFSHSGLVFELCSDVEVRSSLFRDCGGFGRSMGQNWVQGALTFGETVRGRAIGNRFEGCVVAICVRQSGRGDLLRPTQRNYDWNYAWPANAAQGRYWIGAEFDRVNAPGTKSNLATGQLDLTGNYVDSGRVLINAGIAIPGQDPLAGMRALLGTIRFTDNVWGAGVQFDELERMGMNEATWKEWGRQRGYARS